MKFNTWKYGLLQNNKLKKRTLLSGNNKVFKSSLQQVSK